MNNEKKMTKDAPMYLWATEMVDGYYSQLDLKDKSVLTITGSGDQVLNALFRQPSEVYGFDINENSLFITELKIKAIQNISYERFLKFFSFEDGSFEYNTYATFSDTLSIACKNYFDIIYSKKPNQSITQSEYFRRREFFTSNDILKRINVYLKSADQYNELRDMLLHSSPQLFKGNIISLWKNEHIKGKSFDIINLSNVPNYLTGKTFHMTELEVLSLFKVMRTLLNSNGIIIYVSYDNAIYPNDVAQDIPPISRDSFLTVLEDAKEFEVSQKFFPGLHKGQTDRITILKKQD
jgi:S-adenosylmethionine:diacylglycerol 3-amino-3-carboxypropyl transferase